MAGYIDCAKYSQSVLGSLPSQVRGLDRWLDSLVEAGEGLFNWECRPQAIQPQGIASPLPSPYDSISKYITFHCSLLLGSLSNPTCNPLL